MKKCLLATLLLFAYLKVHSQLGITVAPTLNVSREWQVVVENYIVHRRADFLQHGTTALFDYRLRSKTDAWRLQPAVHFSRATVTYFANYFPHHFEVSAMGAQLNLSFCPFLFSKKSEQEKRGILQRTYVQFSPGIDWVGMKYDLPIGEDDVFTGEFERHASRNLSFNLGFNVFTDFRLSDFLTLSPLAGLRFYPNLRWKNFTDMVSQGRMSGTFDRTNWRQFVLGFRVGLALEKRVGKEVEP